MSLLASVTQPNPNGFYFALDNAPHLPTVVAPAFEATGGQGLANGSFTANGDGTVGGIEMFNMDTLIDASGVGGIRQFAIGLEGVAAGANVGNDLFIKCFDDSGALIDTAMSITRATGDVSFASVLNVGTNIVMNGTITGATNIVEGQDNYIVDEDYTAPQPAAAGFTQSVVGTFTPPKAGLYLVSASYGVDTDISVGYTATPPDSIGWSLRPSGAPPYPVDSIAGVAMPVFTVAAGASNDYGFNASTIGNLAAVQYDIIANVDNISGTMSGAALVTRIKVASLA
jgi:hypothetical protein